MLVEIIVTSMELGLSDAVKTKLLWGDTNWKTLVSICSCYLSLMQTELDVQNQNVKISPRLDVSHFIQIAS